MSKKGKKLVFVYGTLMSEYGNNRLLQRGGAKFIGEATTKHSYLMLASGGHGIPFVVDANSDYPSTFWLENCSLIKGEVWECDEATMQDLDALEGHPRWYKREEIKVDIAMYSDESGDDVVHEEEHHTPEGLPHKVKTAWCYLMPLSDKAMQDKLYYPIVVTSGSFRDLVN